MSASDFSEHTADLNRSARANGPPPPNSSPSCKQRIIELLGVPGFWHSYACKRSNGYFGSQSVGDGDIGAYARL